MSQYVGWKCGIHGWVKTNMIVDRECWIATNSLETHSLSFFFLLVLIWAPISNVVQVGCVGVVAVTILLFGQPNHCPLKSKITIIIEEK